MFLAVWDDANTETSGVKLVGFFFLEICWVADSNLNTVTMSSIKIFLGCVLTMGYLKGFIPKNMFIPKKTQHG